MNKTIINGIDVSECIHLDEWKHCNICKELIKTIPDRHQCVTEQDLRCEYYSNCYFKQFKRLQEENKKLTEVTNEAIIEHENLLINRNDFAERAYKLEQENKELKEDINKRTHCISCQRELENCRLSITNAKYKQTLEEIREICKTDCGDCQYNQDCDCNFQECEEAKIDDILNKINEVLK